MNEQTIATEPTPRRKRTYRPKEYRLIPMRECNERDCPLADAAPSAADYIRQNILTSPDHRAEVETIWVLFLNTRRRVKGHYLISTGCLDTLLVHPREVFRAAIVANAAAIILTHSHPSGDPTPSDADIKVTRELIRAGQLIKIELLDHIIMGKPSQSDATDYRSLRELGYFVS